MYWKCETLKGRPKKINGTFHCGNNKLTSLEHRPKEIRGNFDCKNNKKLKNIKEQIIKYQIKAEKYLTDEGDFTFEDIKEDFDKYGEYLLKKENIKLNKNKLNIKDYGLSI